MNAIKYFIVLITFILLGCSNNQYESDAYGNFETKEVLVSSEVNGKITANYLEEGELVEKGKISLIIDTIQLHLKKEQALAQKLAINARLATIDANVHTLEEQRIVSLNEFNRIKNLLKQSAATQQQFDNIKGNIDILDSKIQATLVQKKGVYAEQKTVEATIGIINEQISNCYIKNPISGTIIEIYSEQDELAVMGKALYKIADLNEMDLRVYISGEQLSSIKLGQTVKVLIDSPDRTHIEKSGNISWISEKAEFTPKIIQTRDERINLVYAVKLRVKNDGSIKIGMPGEVIFEDKE